MGRGRRLWRAVVTVATLHGAGLAGAAHAQIGTLGGSAGPPVELAPVATGRDNPFLSKGTGEGVLPIGDWLVSPSAFAGVVYDSNVNQSAVNPTSSFGLRLVPSILGENNNGVSKTTVYGTADLRVYARDALSDSINASSARFGVLEEYRPLPDLTVTARGDYARQQSLFSTFGIDNSVASLNPTGIGLSPTANPTAYHQVTAAAAVQKNVGRGFGIVGGSVLGQVYDETTAGVRSPNGIVYTGIGRAGFWATPALYGFLEGTLDRRDYAVSSLSSSGYRVTGGVGSDRIGLFRGEIFGGYQAEDHDSGGIGTAGAAVFGARGYYYPLPELTLSLAADRTLGASLLETPNSPGGTATEVTSFLLQADYSIAREWIASARAGYIRSEFLGARRNDNAWTIGPTVLYSVWRNFGLTFDYQHLQLSSSAAGQGFSRDVITLGLNYRY